MSERLPPLDEESPSPNFSSSIRSDLSESLLGRSRRSLGGSKRVTPSFKAKRRWTKVKDEVVPMVASMRNFVNHHLARPTPKRFQQALKGPDMEDIDESEVITDPIEGNGPFLLRFTINTFGICIGLSSQVSLWKNLASQSSVAWANVPSIISSILWCITATLLVTFLITYLSKAFVWIGAVKNEWGHPVRINFFFAPCITAGNLFITLPNFVASEIHPYVFIIVAIPLLILDILIFGEWFAGKDRLLCDVANPTTNLSVCSNFVCANLAAVTGWDEAALIFFAIGIAHYIAVFVSLYQQLPTSEKVPENMHPVYFMFVSPPCAAALAWSKINGSFDLLAKSFFFIAIFLYMCLLARITKYLQIRFTLSWWAYCFPISLAANASILYSSTVTNLLTQALSFGLSVIATSIVLCVFSVTAFKFFTGELFPKDLVLFIGLEKKSDAENGDDIDGDDGDDDVDDVDDDVN